MMVNRLARLASITALRKAARIVKDYVVDVYFPIHQVSWRAALQTGPLLMLIEYMVYRVDGVADDAPGAEPARTRGVDEDSLQRYKAKFIRLLEHLDAYDACVAREVEMGEQYVLLEHKVTASATLDRAEIVRLAELRPSDVRLLHSLLIRQLHEACDEQLLALLWPVEVMAEIGNDFKNYQEDVARGHYNTYDMFVRLYREDAAWQIRLELARYERLFLERLAAYPTSRRDELMRLCQKLYQAHTRVIPAPRTQAMPRAQSLHA